MGNELITRDQLQSDLENLYNNKISPYLNGATHTGFTPVGTVISYFGETAPAHYLICDGATYNKSDYPELWTHLSSLTDTTPYVVDGDNTKFKVPDLRGEFLRGTGTNGHTDQGNGANVGVHQNATSMPKMWSYMNQLMQTNRNLSTENVNPKNIDSEHTQGTYVNYVSGNNQADSGHKLYYTSRPTNTSVLFCIAYKDIYIDYALDGFPVDISNPQDKQGLTFDATTQKWVNGTGGLHEYSTTEKVVGTWIDGRPVYEIVLVGTLPTTSTDGVLVTNVAANLPSDAKNLVKLESIWYGDAGATTWSGAFPVIDTMYSAGLGFTTIFCANDGSVRISNSIVRYSGRRVYIIISYTKTTDTPTVQS